MLPKISEHMWCYHCEHEWETDDYYNCKECPNCKQEPIHIMRTSSTGYVYAWMSKHKNDIRDKKIDSVLIYSKGKKIKFNK